MPVLTKVFSVLVSASFVFALLCGRMAQLGDAIINGASDAVSVSVSMLGMLCLWKGIINVLDGAGVTTLISKLSRPILCRIYPAAFKKGVGTSEISANFAANLLGLGNAALPSGLSAMQNLAQDRSLYHDMMTFSVLATCPIQLVPTTLIALRSASGSLAPHAIIAPILVCSLATVCFAVVLCRICAFFDSRKWRKR